MQVVVDVAAEPATVALEEPADCGRFHVAVRGGGDAGALDEALRASAVGSLDGDGEALVRRRRGAAPGGGLGGRDVGERLRGHARLRPVQGLVERGRRIDPGARGAGVVSQVEVIP